jgi:glycerol-3-phosphate responsive antiterminator
LNSEVEDWNLNEFTCSDLSELILLKEKVTAKPVEELKEYVCDDLKNMLKKVLVHYGLINGSQKKDKEELYIYPVCLVW